MIPYTFGKYSEVKTAERWVLYGSGFSYSHAKIEMSSMPSLPSLPSLCLPAAVYLALAAISLIGVIANGANLMTIILTVLTSGLWALILQMFCSAGYPSISWVILLFPIIVLAVVLMFFTGALLSMKV